MSHTTLALTADPLRVTVRSRDSSVEALCVLQHHVWAIFTWADVAEQGRGIQTGRTGTDSRDADLIAAGSHVTHAVLLGAQVPAVAAVWRGRQGDGLGDGDAGGAKARDLGGIVRQQANGMNTERVEHRGRGTVVPRVDRQTKPQV